MSTKAKRSSKKSSRYNPQPELTPIYGVKKYIAESGFLLSTIAIFLFSAARIYMSLIEQKNAGSVDIFALLGILATILLSLGSIITLIGAYLKQLPGIFIFSGLFLMLAANGIFCCCFALESLSEFDILGVIQCIFEVLFLISTFILLITLLISCLNKRTAASVGLLPTIISLFTVALLVVRTFTTFASLSSALGSSFSWDKTSDIANEVSWVLRSISVDSEYAPEMYYARFLERIAVILLFAALLTPIFRFSMFFKQYNIQMDISMEMPNAHRNVREQKGTPFMGGRFDLRSSLTSLKDSDDHQNDEVDDPEIEEQHDDMAEEEVLGFCTPDYISGFDEPDEQISSYNEPEPPVRHVVYNTNLLDSDYGKIIDDTDYSVHSPDANKNPARTESGAYRVKLRSSIPNPDDESIWNNYTE